MKRLIAYVHSFEVATVDFLDKEGAMHACAQAQKTAFQGLGQISGMLANRYLPDDEKEAVTVLQNFCKDNDLEFEVVDLAMTGFFTRAKMRIKGLKTPTICCDRKSLHGVPSEKKLEELVNV